MFLILWFWFCLLNSILFSVKLLGDGFSFLLMLLSTIGSAFLCTVQSSSTYFYSCLFNSPVAGVLVYQVSDMSSIAKPLGWNLFLLGDWSVFQNFCGHPLLLVFSTILSWLSILMWLRNWLYSLLIFTSKLPQNLTLCHFLSPCYSRIKTKVGFICSPCLCVWFLFLEDVLRIQLDSCYYIIMVLFVKWCF